MSTDLLSTFITTLPAILKAVATIIIALAAYKRRKGDDNR
jgi:hypothetical protein